MTIVTCVDIVWVERQLRVKVFSLPYWSITSNWLLSFTSINVCLMFNKYHHFLTCSWTNFLEILQSKPKGIIKWKLITSLSKKSQLDPLLSLFRKIFIFKALPLTWIKEENLIGTLRACTQANSKQINFPGEGKSFIFNAYILLSGKIRSRKFDVNLRGSSSKTSLKIYSKQSEQETLNMVFLIVKAFEDMLILLHPEEFILNIK